MRRALVLSAALCAIATWIPVNAQRPEFSTGAPAEIEAARGVALEHLQRRLAERGIERIGDLQVTQVTIDELSMAHVRVQQYFRGVPVFGGEAIVHLQPDGRLSTETDALQRFVRVNTTPQLDAAAAIDRAIAHYGCRDCLTDQPQAGLWILRRDEADLDHLVYRVSLSRLDGTAASSAPVIFIDAMNGGVVFEYDNLQTAIGRSLYSGDVSIGTSFNNFTSRYYTENLTNNIGTFDMRNGVSSFFRFPDIDNEWFSSAQRAAVDVHYGTEQYLAYLQATFKRVGLDGQGGPTTVTAHDGATQLLSSRVHYGSSFCNSFWSFETFQLSYGDCNGVAASPLVTIDIVGHELTHGVVQYTAGLIYKNESGALNESWADVFGAMLERDVRGESSNTWLIAEEALTPAVSGDALRHLDNPHAVATSRYTADDDPDHYSERYVGSSDDGGVHVNSGIANKAFYLLAKGGTHHLGGSMTGIGAAAASSIWFRALRVYMTSSTNFAGARSATLNAATDLFGRTSIQRERVKTAWCLVGVGVCGNTR